MVHFGNLTEAEYDEIRAITLPMQRAGMTEEEINIEQRIRDKIASRAQGPRELKRTYDESSLFVADDEPEPQPYQTMAAVQPAPRPTSHDQEMADAPSSPEEPLSAVSRRSSKARREQIKASRRNSPPGLASSLPASRRSSEVAREKAKAVRQSPEADLSKSTTLRRSPEVVQENGRDTRKNSEGESSKRRRQENASPVDEQAKKVAATTSMQPPAPSSDAAISSKPMTIMSMKIAKAPKASGSSAPASTSNIAPRDPEKRMTLAQLKDLPVYIKELDDRIAKNDNLEPTFTKLRKWLRLFEHKSVDGSLVKLAKVLHTSGLQRLFKNPHAQLELDIAADAEALHNKWQRGDYDASVLRGIATQKDSKALKLDDEVVRIKGASFGAGDLVSGQWWPKRIMALRDGAHGAMQAGIHGKRGDGAYSIVIAGQYDDEDHGDVVKYCGTEAKTGTQITDDTQLLKDSLKSKKNNVVRVLRSGNSVGSASKRTPYMPEFGYRYDGLYKVTEEKSIKGGKNWLFTLERLPGQYPIRHQGPHARPTIEDRRAYETVKAYSSGGN